MKKSILLAIFIVILIRMWMCQYTPSSPISNEVEVRVHSVKVVDDSELMHGSMLVILNDSVAAWVVSKTIRTNRVTFLIHMREARQGRNGWEPERISHSDCYYYWEGEKFTAKIARPSSDATMITCEYFVQFFRDGKSVAWSNFAEKPVYVKDLKKHSNR